MRAIWFCLYKGFKKNKNKNNSKNNNNKSKHVHTEEMDWWFALVEEGQGSATNLKCSCLIQTIVLPAESEPTSYVVFNNFMIMMN